MSRPPRLILSTVGISVLTNALTPEEDAWRKRLNKLANEKELPEDARQIAEIAQKAGQQILSHGDVAKRRALSAELNGLYGYYSGQLTQAKVDYHLLIGTDTALGKMALQTVKGFLQQQGIRVDDFIPSDFSARSQADFAEGIKQILSYCQRILPDYRAKKYRIVFNLTAAFKSMQGYLNTVGMMLADEIVYIFESGAEVVSIPRLPLRVDIEALRDYRIELALMAHGHLYPTEDVADIPAGLIEEQSIDGTSMAALSGWGQIIWADSRNELLGDDLLPFPRLQFTPKFRDAFRRAASAERAALQDILAKVAYLLEGSKGNTARLKGDGGLQYENYENKTLEGRPVGHFRVSLSRRVNCLAENGGLKLLDYGGHDIENTI